MPLNPLRDALGQTGLDAQAHESPFKAEADAALASFQAARSDLHHRVRRGELTPKVARQRATEAATSLRDDLLHKAEGYSPAARAFLDRLVEADNARKRARESMSIEGLQREMNRLLRQSLVEQQVVSRSAEFEGQAFERPLAGGPPAPTLDSLLSFHEAVTLSGDEAAREWARRQLESLRNRVITDDDQRRIDMACDRPDQVNPRLVSAYVEAMRDRSPEELEAFVAQALDGGDASSCAGAFVLARQAEGGTGLRWVRLVLNGLSAFPDAALATLRGWEVEARKAEAEAALAQARFAVSLAEAEARLADIEAPSNQELQQQARLQAKPVARWDEPIGLTLSRRGRTDDELAAEAGAPPA